MTPTLPPPPFKRKAISPRVLLLRGSASLSRTRQSWNLFFFFFFLPHHNSPLPFFIHSASLNARYLIYIHWNISHSSGPRVFSLSFSFISTSPSWHVPGERGENDGRDWVDIAPEESLYTGNPSSSWIGVYLGRRPSLDPHDVFARREEDVPYGTETNQYLRRWDQSFIKDCLFISLILLEIISR